MDIASTTFTLVFCVLLIAGFGVRQWLGSRQIRHVARHRAAVPAAFAAQIDLTAHQKAADYTIVKTRLSLLSATLGAVVLLGWTLLGGLNTLNLALLSAIGPGLWQQIALVAAFSVIGGLIGLPLSWWATFGVEARFGFNRSSLGLWVSDGVKSALVGAAVGLPLLAVVLWLMGAAGNTWWLWAWGLWMAFNLLMLVIYPTVIAPMFNQFKPLDDPALQGRVQSLMQRCGFTAKGLFVMDGSKRSAHANAYFTGFGAAKRVVFFDTLLAQLSPGEIDAVLAHELGHFKHRHIIKRIGVLFAVSGLALAALGFLANQPWFYAGMGVMPSLDAPNGALALILFVLFVPLVSFFVSPLMSLGSRNDEFQADAYASEHAQASDLASALLKLYKDNASTLTPDPLYVRFYHSHPPASERLGRLLKSAAPA